MDDTTIRTAVTEWLSDASAAEATYGHISTWETSGVTDMNRLFCAFCDGANSAASSFNEDIGAWDTSGVRNMYGMFQAAGAFNQDISGWAVHNVISMGRIFEGARNFNQDLSDWDVESVTNMNYMFDGASAFDQDLGWCVDDDVDLINAFRESKCSSTSCGVTRKNEFDECEAIVEFVFDFDFGDDDDDDDDFDDDDDGLGALFGNHAASTRSAALAALVLGAALA